MVPMRFGSVRGSSGRSAADSYLPDRGLATAIFLALSMRRPLLLEGEPGVGKTEVGKSLARVLDAELMRLQCYEGIDASQALYEWDYARQLLLRARARGSDEVRRVRRSTARTSSSSGRCCTRSAPARARCC